MRWLAPAAIAAAVLILALATLPGITLADRVAGISHPRHRVHDAHNILDYDADPSGTLDSTRAWNAACAAVPVTGGVILLPGGTYLAASPWVCDGKPVTVEGGGQGVSVIKPTHTGTALSFKPGSLSYPVTVEGLTLQAAGACATGTGIVIRYPLAPSWLRRTATVRDVEILAALGATTACAPSSFTQGLVLYGLWNAVVENVIYIGPAAFPSLPGTIGVSFSNSRNLAIDKATVYYASVGFLQADYSEGVQITGANAVSVNVGFHFPRGATVSTSDTSGLSITIDRAECAPVNVCIWLDGIFRAYLTNNRIEFASEGPGDVGILLVDTVGAFVSNNALQGQANSVSTGLEVRGPNIASGLSDIHDNQCLNLAVCMRLGVGTAANTATRNSHPNGTGTGVFIDLGAGNATDWTSQATK